MWKFLVFISIIVLARSQDIPPGVCDGINIGFVPHPDPQLCDRFFLCVLEVPQPMECVTGSIFDPNINDCVPGVCQPALTTEAPTTTEETTTQFPNTDIPTTPEGINTDVPTEITTEEITEETTTTTFEIILTPTLPVLTTTTPPGQETTQRPIGPPELCIGNNFRYVADPESCYRFYYCMFGIALPGECALDRIFSERWRGCVFGNRETCTPNLPIFNVNIN